MLGAIAGDIIGSRFEGMGAVSEAFDFFAPSSTFTDDTVCILAVAEAAMDGLDFNENLRRMARRYPMRGYGERFWKWVTAEGAPAYGSFGNGAPMRVGPIGWLARSEGELFNLSDAQAAVTHDHPEAMAASRAVALAIFLARSGHSPNQIKVRVQSDFGYDLDKERSGFDLRAGETTMRALRSALNADCYETAIRDVMRGGGDTDTLACIAGGVAEALHGMPAEIWDAAREYLPVDFIRTVHRFQLAVASCTLNLTN